MRSSHEYPCERTPTQPEVQPPTVGWQMSRAREKMEGLENTGASQKRKLTIFFFIVQLSLGQQICLTFSEVDWINHAVSLQAQKFWSYWSIMGLVAANGILFSSQNFQPMAQEPVLSGDVLLFGHSDVSTSLPCKGSAAKQNNQWVKQGLAHNQPFKLPKSYIEMTVLILAGKPWVGAWSIFLVARKEVAK